MDVSTQTLQLKRSQKTAGEPHLSFWLDERTPAVIAMDSAREVVVLPAASVTPMPNMPASVLGLLNRRSRVLWLVDLAQLMLSTPPDRGMQDYAVAIVQVPPAAGNEALPAQRQPLLGLAVRNVRGIIRFPADAIQSPLGQFASSLTPYLKGCVLYQQEMVLVLDTHAIARSSLLQAR
jgi:twitching motility protein PilI